MICHLGINIYDHWKNFCNFGSLIWWSCKIGVLENVPKGVYLLKLNHAFDLVKLQDRCVGECSKGSPPFEVQLCSKGTFKVKTSKSWNWYYVRKRLGPRTFQLSDFSMRAEVLILQVHFLKRVSSSMLLKVWIYKHNLGALSSKYMYSTLIIKVTNIYWSSPWHKITY